MHFRLAIVRRARHLAQPLRVIALSLAFAIGVGHAAAGEPVVVSVGHLAAAVRLIDAMGFAEDFALPSRRWLQELRLKDPAGASRMSAVMEPFLQPDYVHRELAPFIAGQLSQVTCMQVAAFWEGPVGRKFRSAQRALLSTGSAPKLELTPDENTEAARFQATAAFAELSAAMPTIERRIKAYSRETQDKMRSAFADQSSPSSQGSVPR